MVHKEGDADLNIDEIAEDIIVSKSSDEIDPNYFIVYTLFIIHILHVILIFV